MKKLLLCSALTILCFAASAQEPERKGSGVENALLDAVELIDGGNFQAASTMLDSLAAVAPANDAVRYYQGICRFSTGKFAEAEACFSQALSLDPENNWYKETLANLYINSGKIAQAEALYRELQADNPAKYPGIYVDAMLALAHRGARDYPSFFAALRRLVNESEADDDMKYEALMNALGNFDSRTLNAIMPQLDTLMRSYVEAEPRSVHAHNLCMQTAGTLGDHERVIEECRALMALQPDDPEQQCNCLAIIGDTYYQTGNTRKAFKTYDQVLKIDPEYCHTLNNYAYYLSLLKRRLAKAEKMSLITVTKEPDNPTYLDTYGWILYLRGKAKEAKPYFKHAMLYGGKDSAVILMHFSLVLEKLGEKDLATYYRNLAESKKK